MGSVPGERRERSRRERQWAAERPGAETPESKHTEENREPGRRLDGKEELRVNHACGSRTRLVRRDLLFFEDGNVIGPG